ncbi:deoxyribose-phosphate aldolase [Staphylotrichum tortipilum]|uniref:deoxyribose-phosphate aldolase n=1 Tax=Staphylotrichum tortipilum TaxID=2831512 RepID=A0AAN6RSG0_9PEZI|nr:deoxyribose-phosphate aldolase [Staphylotrichum longicolle]
MPSPGTITVSLPQLAKLIDHSLLQPFFTDGQIDAGLTLARDYKVAAACVKPYSIPAAKAALAGSDVLVCAVIGFPHGNSTTEIKVAEAAAAVRAGAEEIDMVVNVGKVLGGQWEYVADEIKAINDVVVAQGGALKVIFENDFLEHQYIARLCQICTDVGVAFVKTSTGYGFVKQRSGQYDYVGATVPHVKLMKESCGEGVKIKAAGGVRSVDEFLYMMHLGVSRIGTSGTAAILEEARRRGIGDDPVEVKLVDPVEYAQGGGY